MQLAIKSTTTHCPVYYLEWRTPNHQTFKIVKDVLEKNGMLKVNRRNAGQPRQVRTILVEEEILERVDENPETSVRLLERQNTLPDLFDDLPLNLRNQMYFMHDGAQPHFARIVREYLNEQLTGRCIGRGNDAPISWPPRSPDSNPCDFFIWGDLKQNVYSHVVIKQERRSRYAKYSVLSILTAAFPSLRLDYEVWLLNNRTGAAPSLNITVSGDAFPTLSSLDKPVGRSV
ncbi:hypothetical protein NQ318_019606 [Aromia moschata]|uniref:Uncharacterized protein n=1 Tax=Aromia moschata TaxID=1265417 RepID=A0AAV8Z6L9_9CUCU|nr:hypothetical protein NQ318_019606 [Aromia moschata]